MNSSIASSHLWVLIILFSFIFFSSIHFWKQLPFYNTKSRENSIIQSFKLAQCFWFLLISHSTLWALVRSHVSRWVRRASTHEEMRLWMSISHIKIRNIFHQFHYKSNLKMNSSSNIISKEMLENRKKLENFIRRQKEVSPYLSKEKNYYQIINILMK